MVYMQHFRVLTPPYDWEKEGEWVEAEEFISEAPQPTFVEQAQPSECSEMTLQQITHAGAVVVHFASAWR